MPVPNPKRPSSLRLIFGLPPPGALRRRRILGGATEAALQVVEDEPDGRNGPRRRRNPPRVPADDEDAAFGGRGLELRDPVAVGAKLACAREQLGARPGQSLGR